MLQMITFIALGLGITGLFMAILDSAAPAKATVKATPKKRKAAKKTTNQRKATSKRKATPKKTKKT